MEQYSKALSLLYSDVSAAENRYLNAAAEFERLFGAGREVIFVSAPGRTEIGGNHTDHQRGSVLAAAVNLDVICAASPKSAFDINIVSEGYSPCVIALDNLNPRLEEKGRPSALIRGIADWFTQNGYNTGGFDAYMTSQVLSGSGLSSSAAFEVAVGCILNHLYNKGSVPPEEIAAAGQFAENAHFGKPCGLMDQTASAVGGFVKIDFANPEKPLIEHLDFNLESYGYALCITDTGGNHSEMTAEYAAISSEMREVAAYYGKNFLSEIDERVFYSDIPQLRIKAGDRAVLRAMHFFGENERVKKQAAAISNGGINAFLRLVNESGESSQRLLQNIYAAGSTHEQGLALAIALSEKKLTGTGGAWRVHGGGFAGTVQAYVPLDILSEYRAFMDGVFGEGSCRELKIRRFGEVKLWRD